MFQDELKKFDVRIVQRNIQEGIVTPDQFQAYLDSLPDVSSNLDRAYHLDFTFIHRDATFAAPDREAGSSSPASETQHYHSDDDLEDD